MQSFKEDRTSKTPEIEMVNRNILTLPQCNLTTPCTLCPKSDTSKQSNWKAVGCRRGDFTSMMYPIKLCRFVLIKSYITPAIQQALDDINRYWEGRVDSRKRDLARLVEKSSFDDESDPLFRTKEFQDGFKMCLPGTGYSHISQLILPALVPLNEYILAILLDCARGSLPSSIEEDAKVLDALVNLLPRAAKYQGSYQGQLGSVGMSFE
jgi:hypothetical protein